MKEWERQWKLLSRVHVLVCTPLKIGLLVGKESRSYYAWFCFSFLGFWVKRLGKNMQLLFRGLSFRDGYDHM